MSSDKYEKVSDSITNEKFVSCNFSWLQRYFSAVAEKNLEEEVYYMLWILSKAFAVTDTD